MHRNYHHAYGGGFLEDAGVQVEMDVAAFHLNK